MIRILHVKEAHIAAVLAIENACFSPPWSEGALLGEVGRPDGLFTIAVEEGHDAVSSDIVGFCIVRCIAGEAEFYQLAVRGDTRRKGVADCLMRTALAYCRENRIESIYLEVRRSNEAAIRLYKKHGFKNEGRRKNYYSSPVEDAIMMSLTLDTKV
jgi:ribosomal-protein-alanine N-acetyltransferase